MLPRWPTNPFGIVPQFPQFPCQVLIFINLLFLLQFHPSIPWYSNTDNLANCLLLSTTTRSGLLCASWRLYYKIPKDFDFLGLSKFPGTCSYNLSATSNPYFLHRHQWTAFATPSCLPLYSVWAKAEHSQTMRLTDSSLLLRNLHFDLTACLSIFSFYCTGSQCLVLGRC